MRFDSLVGPSYASQSVNVDCQITMNLYPEVIESGQGKSRMALFRAPGLKKFAALSDNGQAMASVREMLFFSGRLFAIAEQLFASSAQVLWEVFSDGTFTRRGTLGTVGGAKPSMAANNANQLMIASGGSLFLYRLDTNVLTAIDTTTGTALQGAVAKVGFDDAYFVALLQNSQKFQISSLLDGATWDPADIAQVEQFPDNVLAMIVDHREIPFFGPKQSIVYYDSGNPDFPFDTVPGAFVEQGIHAVDSLSKLDNTLFWIGADERGGAMGYRAQGYTPSRISNHAIEFAWQRYSKSDDAVGFSYQENGHTFWVLYFPNASKTWVYDVSTQMWHQRQRADGKAYRAQCFAKAFGKNLVGDWGSGNIYEMSTKYLDEDGTPMKRLRRGPHISDEQNYRAHTSLQVDCETGLGPQPPLLDGDGRARAPKMYMRYSSDGGKTWSNEKVTDVGQAGQSKARAIWRRLGRARDRVYEIYFDDPIDWSITTAYLEMA